MAKMVVKTLARNTYANLRPLFDEIAEDCSILSVSNDGTTLILTIDTDLVVNLAEPTNTSYYMGARSATFNGNSIYNTTSQVAGSYPTRHIIMYNDEFFFWLALGSTGLTSSNLCICYEKLEGNKYAGGSTNINIVDLKDIDNVSVARVPSFSGSLAQPQLGYIDLIGGTLLTLGGVRVAKDTNVMLCLKAPVLEIVTINGKDYYAPTSNFLIPIDDE